MSLNGHQLHVLCIDQAPEVLEVLRLLLEDEGYRVSTRTTLDRTLDSIVRLDPDVIIIDYMWDTSDNDWTLLNLLTIDPRTRDVPVILCTAAVKRAMEMQSHLESIGVKVVFKPFDIETVLEALSEALGAKSTKRQDIAS